MVVNRWVYAAMALNLLCALNATRAVAVTQGPWWVVLILATCAALNYATAAFLWSFRK